MIPIILISRLHRADLLAQLHFSLLLAHALPCSLLAGQRGKWAARTIRFDSNGFEGLPDGTPLGGVITWNSKRLFPREQRGVSIADITKVEHDGKVGSQNDQVESRPPTGNAWKRRFKLTRDN